MQGQSISCILMDKRTFGGEQTRGRQDLSQCAAPAALVALPPAGHGQTSEHSLNSTSPTALPSSPTKDAGACSCKVPTFYGTKHSLYLCRRGISLLRISGIDAGTHFWTGWLLCCAPRTFSIPREPGDVNLARRTTGKRRRARIRSRGAVCSPGRSKLLPTNAATFLRCAYRWRASTGRGRRRRQTPRGRVGRTAFHFPASRVRAFRRSPISGVQRHSTRVEEGRHSAPTQPHRCHRTLPPLPPAALHATTSSLACDYERTCAAHLLLFPSMPSPACHTPLPAPTSCNTTSSSWYGRVAWAWAHGRMVRPVRTPPAPSATSTKTCSTQGGTFLALLCTLQPRLLGGPTAASRLSSSSCTFLPILSFAL